ncbi:Mobile element protein [Euzebya pacifica]|uniref:Mobile element protein n=1 Tax=Euzebya pacifica TaxID=1608957 RepID=A0A346XRX0_9ACTN|nr:IS21 family transposase [Euzebya pacifica]AXV04967.1 Mobile element protein [Euzebya pacifica]AXV05087.1 Mobile element protein [Euzebya pacifica]AXV06972.1 Mobile element protein [Euzebya pacifica]AXV07606.1 Mobile element protein [Euzebya pacifica]AXV07956.1 Mobile element protein [Euzebya pacifica]
MIDVEQWAEVRRLHFAEGMAIKAIVRATGLSRNTVRAAIRSASPPKYEREAAGSAVDAFEPQIRQLLKATPDMPATVIAERIGWSRGMTVLRDRVRELRPAYLLPEGYGRTVYREGELAQWDLWFPEDLKVPVGFGQTAVLPVIVGVPCYSRWITARMIPSKDKHDVLGGHLWCLRDLGRVPRKGVYDGEPAISVRRGRKLVYTQEYLAFRGTLGMGSIVLAKGHPERKGVVERANGYLETSFMPGRSFGSIDDFNTQLGLWLEDRANVRVHAGLRQRPSERIDADLAAMLPLPPVPPDVDWTHTVRLGADHWVRVDTNDYSVHPGAIGRKVTIRRTADQVVVTCGRDEVARHDRVLAKHQTITDPAHDAARKARAQLLELPVAGPDTGVEQRDLADYDRLLGVA